MARLGDPADEVRVTGDLAEHGAGDEFALGNATLETLGRPTYVLPGNTDDRRRLRHHFGLPGQPPDPIY